MKNNWIKKYQDSKAWGMLTSIDVHGCNPQTIRDEQKIREYVDLLCENIKMKKFGETVIVHFGEDKNVEGYSMTQLIETSLISGHFANHSNRVFIDIFSCKPYDPDEAVKFTMEFFEGNDFDCNIILRK